MSDDVFTDMLEDDPEDQAMSERPTPETDALWELWRPTEPHAKTVANLCRRLERERDDLRDQLSESTDQCLTWAASSDSYSKEAYELREALARERSMLLDPAQVHHGMLRGTVAKLDWKTLEHIHGEHPLRGLAKELADALDDANLLLLIGLSELHDHRGPEPGSVGHKCETALAKARDAGIL